jgi:hypothetical protein
MYHDLYYHTTDGFLWLFSVLLDRRGRKRQGKAMTDVTTTKTCDNCEKPAAYFSRERGETTVRHACSEHAEAGQKWKLMTALNGSLHQVAEAAANTVRMIRGE